MKNIQYKLGFLMLTFAVVLVVSVYIVFSVFNKKEIERNAFNTTKVVSQKIDALIYQKLIMVEVLTETMANIATTIDLDYEKNKKTIKTIIDLKGYEDFIAGGGIWPEPYSIDKTKERNSYFFARDKNGKLKFYDDYNNPKGISYHHEEWYVPAKFYKKSKIYWSKSYIDPYSFEPMVTASAPIYKNGKFMGVATIDIMLHGLKKLLEANIQNIGGYGFIVDRNNKFLTFPNEKISKINNDYITLDKLAEMYPNCSKLNKKILQKNIYNFSKEDDKLMEKLQKEIYHLESNTSKNIVALIKDNSKHTKTFIDTIMIENDPLLHEKSMAIAIKQPKTHWTLVVVIPLKIILEQSNNVFNNLILVIFLLIFIFFNIGYYAIKNSIIKPMTLMTKKLDIQTENLKELNKTLNERVKSEVEKNIQKDKKMLEQSRLAQMGEMISMIAHQWRQPLSSISSTILNLDMKLKLDIFDLETQEGRDEQNRYFTKRFNNINDYVQNLTQIIDDFRHFYKPNKSSLKISLDIIVQKALNIIENSLINSGITILQDYKNLEAIELYDGEMMQVVLNILKNAQDNFKEKETENATIYISIDKTTLTICDNGGGISKDIIGNIFTPYFSTKDEKNGTGLGLYMSKTIIEEHHKGKLDVENRDDGVCFIMHLNSTI